MNRRRFLQAAGIGLAAFYTSRSMAMGNNTKKNPVYPNIVFIMADDLGYGDVGFTGNKVIKTPNLDAMSKESLVFNRFYAGGPVCSPTRGTCLTGRHYFRYGIFSASAGYLPKEEITLARICREKGYTTGHFGKWHLAPITMEGPAMPEYEENRQRKYGPPWERDYDEAFATECNVPTWDPYDNERFKPVFRLPFLENGREVNNNVQGAASLIVMDRAIPFMRKAVENKKPFLATIWFHEPHEPVVAGPKYREMYKEYDEPQQHYYGCITAMDEQIGRLRKELREMGAAENTIVWFCSDNGPEGMDGKGNPNWCYNSRGVTGGLRGRKRSLFDGGLAGPALLEWPGRIKPRAVDVPCSTLDYFPTTVEITGYQMPDNRPIDGISLLPLISGKMKKRPKPIPFCFINASKNAMHGSPTFALIDNDLKFLTNLSQDGQEDLLFNISKDRDESTNILPEHRKTGAKMRSYLRKWINSCRQSHSGADYPTHFEPVGSFPEMTGMHHDKKG